MRAALLAVITAATLSAVLPARAEYFADTPMPEGRGCWITDTEPIFDGYRHGTRVHWRCPHFSEHEEEEDCCESAEPDEPQVYEADMSEPDPQPEPEPEYTFAPPTTSAPAWQPPSEPPRVTQPSSSYEPSTSYRGSPGLLATGGFLVVLTLIVLLIVAATSDTDASSLDRDVRETRALTDRLNAAAREADARIAAFLKKEGLDG